MTIEKEFNRRVASGLEDSPWHWRGLIEGWVISDMFNKVNAAHFAYITENDWKFFNKHLRIVVKKD